MTTDSTNPSMRRAGLACPVFGAIAATLTLCVGGFPLAAQTTVTYITEPLPEPMEPRYGGQWSGPFDLLTEINPLYVGANPSEENRDWGEIVHAVALPPPNDGKVLLMCRRKDITPNGGDLTYRSFVWDRLNPDSLAMYEVDPGPTNGSRDPFCGGQTLTREGNVVFVGGINSPLQTLANPAWGNNATYLFVNDTPPWWKYQIADVPAMQRARYYPTVTRVRDGSLVVTGHDKQPLPPLVPTQSGTNRERADVDDVNLKVIWRGSPVVSKMLLENVVGPDSTCTATAPLVNLGEYPRVYPLMSGDLLVTSTSSYLLRFDTCPGADNPDRWLALPASPQPRSESSGAHFIDFTTSPPTEIIYSIAGAAHDGTQGTSQVLRMEIKKPPYLVESSVWESNVPQLHTARTFQHAVIMLDGSILVVGGGFKDDITPAPWVFWKHPEIYHPPVIWNSPSADWHYANPQVHERSYHSVAVLLPNGDVMSGGGQGISPFSGTPEVPWDTVETYRPSHVFVSPKPSISTYPATLQLGTTGHTLQVKLMTTNGEGELRVALVAPGASTHAYDSNQMYVKLNHETVFPNDNRQADSTIVFNAPPTGAIPPGWYMLTVVNSVGHASDAKWVRVTL